MTNVESGHLYNWERIGRSMTNVVLVNDKCATQTSRRRLLGIRSMTNVKSGDLHNWECIGRSMTNVVLVND